ncbi:MAG: TlpA family protein disulfide reductase [Flavobacterium sp.]|nr:MAG: TlpA family protein disulfide reductase [Flavobacterium sp.]
MKMIIYSCLCVFLLSCGNSTTENPSEEAVADMVETNNKKTTAIAETRHGIQVYNFEGLDEALLQHKNDTTYVINFWATWCKPCVKEMPYFEKMGKTYAEEKVKVVFVSLDFPDRLEPLVVPFIKKNKLESEVVLLDDDDANSWIPKVSEKWQGAIPATLIYNADERAFFERSFTYEELEKEVQSILNKS